LCLEREREREKEREREREREKIQQPKPNVLMIMTIFDCGRISSTGLKINNKACTCVYNTIE